MITIEERVLRALSKDGGRWHGWDEYKPKLEMVRLGKNFEGKAYDAQNNPVLAVEVKHGCVCVEGLDDDGNPMLDLGAVPLVTSPAVVSLADYYCACALSRHAYKFNTEQDLEEAADIELFNAMFQNEED